MNILDCTLRDGGNKNNWNFSNELIRLYLKTMQSIGIKHVEIGLRSLIKNDSLGQCAYSTEEFLESLDIPKELEIAVMIKADEILQCENPEIALDDLFTEASNSHVTTVRVAMLYQKGLGCFKIIEYLKEKGYKTVLNLTKTHPGCEDELADITFGIQNWDCLDILYFADTFGELTPNDIKKDITAIKQVNDKALGFHGHNNKGLAYKNALAAIESGANFIDSTVTGIGKGSGNLKTEEIIKKYPNRYNANSLEELINLISCTQKGKIYDK